ncbi:MAG TPA: BON domain-containing protein [Acidobacteriaceae bacterium]|nr:BON domain-containing protein [Acidobacteriaceae bacterium]
MRTRLPLRYTISVGALCAWLLLSTGCKQQAAAPNPAPASATEQTPPPPPSDQQLLSSIQAKINGESALSGQHIEVSVADSVATLSGSVTNDASRALAAADSGSVDGVRTVINNLTVSPLKESRETPPEREKKAKPHHAETARMAPPPPPVQASPPPPPPRPEPVQTIAPPPPPPPPPVKTVTLQPGTVVPIRMTETLDSASTQTDSAFHGSLATDLIVNGMVAIPRGSSVVGRVVSAKDAGHFSGNSELSIELTQIHLRDRELTVVTDPYTKEGAGRGKNTAMKAGGGAALGALIGALAGGGKGAAIGAAAGGGLGAGANGVTRGQQVQIPSETLINFTLKSPVSVTTSKVAGASAQPGYNSNQNGDQPVLKRAPQQ